MHQLFEARRIETSMSGPDVRLHLVGEVDLVSCDLLRVALDATVSEGAGDVILDMSATSFCDSVGLCALLAVRHQLRRRDRRLRVVDPSPTVSRLLDLSGTRALLADRGASRRLDTSPDGGRRVPTP
jgi:anti-anti-sigma factor